jgi:hypothetical protein
MPLQSVVNPNLDNLNQALSTTSDPTFNTVSVSGSPVSSLQVATKAYVDNVAAGIKFHQAVVAATTVAFAGSTYNNGTNGVGATISSMTNISIGTIDGVTVAVGDRILVKSQPSPSQNGIYTVTALGGIGVGPWILTRATDADNNPTGEMSAGDFCFVTSGNTNIGSGFINISTANPIEIGNSNIAYTQFSAVESLTAGAGLTKVGVTIDVGTASNSRIIINTDSIDLANVARSNTTGNIGNTFIQSFTSDSYGRVTGSVLASVASARDTEVRLLMEVI